MGAGPGVTSFAGLPGAVLSVLSGAVLAGAVAWALSSLTPIGPVRRVEVHSGPSLDLVVIGLGVLVIVVTLGLIAVVAGARQAPHREATRVPRPSRSSAAGLAAARGLPLPAVAGVRLALEPGEGRTAVPVRAAMAGAVVAVVALVASLVFATSLDSLVHHPRLYGWDWEATVVDQSGYGNVNQAKTHELLDADPGVAAWSGVFFGSLEIDGHNVPALGVGPDAAVSPPLRSGHKVRAPDELVLGTTTLADLHKRVGDTVLVGRGGQVARMRVVGSAVLPTVGIGHGAYTSLGIGAALPPDKIPGAGRHFFGGDGPNAIFIRFRRGADWAAAIRRITAKADGIGESPGDAVVLSVQRPAEIVNSSHMGATPALLAGGLALAVLVSLGVTLAAGVRRRRRDLALLKSLGFTRGQLSATVAWQAAITMVVGLAVGLPLGIALGRWLWALFARQLSVLSSPTVPVGLLAALAACLLLLAVLAAAAPARAAGRTRVAAILRSE
jgi:phage tail protein X